MAARRRHAYDSIRPPSHLALQAGRALGRTSSSLSRGGVFSAPQSEIDFESTGEGNQGQGLAASGGWVAGTASGLPRLDCHPVNPARSSWKALSPAASESSVEFMACSPNAREATYTEGSPKKQV